MRGAPRHLATLAALAALPGCGGSSAERVATVSGSEEWSERQFKAEQEEIDYLREQIQAEQVRRQQGSRSADGQGEGGAPDAPESSGSSASSGGGLLSTRDRASFSQLERSLGGRSGVAVSALGRSHPVQRAGSLRSAVAWSTAKVPVAMAVIDAGGLGEGSQDLRRAIAASDNAAAERLWSRLGSGQQAARAADAQLRAAGDRRTRTQPQRLRAGFTAFGQTDWALADQARFAAGMSCTQAGKAVVELMGQVIPAHRWGIGAADGSAQIKGGWGPGSSPGATSGYLDRQFGIMRVRGKPIALAIATTPADGSHETGTRNLTRIARWVALHVNARAATSGARC